MSKHKYSVSWDIWNDLVIEQNRLQNLKVIYTTSIRLLLMNI